MLWNIVTTIRSMHTIKFISLYYIINYFLLQGSFFYQLNLYFIWHLLIPCLRLDGLMVWCRADFSAHFFLLSFRGTVGLPLTFSHKCASLFNISVVSLCLFSKQKLSVSIETSHAWLFDLSTSLAHSSRKVKVYSVAESNLVSCLQNSQPCWVLLAPAASSAPPLLTRLHFPPSTNTHVQEPCFCAQSPPQKNQWGLSFIILLHLELFYHW